MLFTESFLGLLGASKKWGFVVDNDVCPGALRMITWFHAPDSHSPIFPYFYCPMITVNLFHQTFQLQTFPCSAQAHRNPCREPLIFRMASTTSSMLQNQFFWGVETGDFSVKRCYSSCHVRLPLQHVEHHFLKRSYAGTPQSQSFFFVHEGRADRLGFRNSVKCSTGDVLGGHML